MHPNQARFNMIEQQIRPWNVLDLQVLELLDNVHRDEFVPAAHKSLAFADLEIPLPAGQCMLAPASKPAFCRTWPSSRTNPCSKSVPAPASWPPCWPTAPARC